MTKVLVVMKEDKIQKISITGHATFAELGKDIVCAAISSAAYHTINAIRIFEREDRVKIKINEKLGEMHIEVVNFNCSTIQKIMTLLKTNLEEIEKQFPKNIETKEIQLWNSISI